MDVVQNIVLPLFIAVPAIYIMWLWFYRCHIPKKLKNHPIMIKLFDDLWQDDDYEQLYSYLKGVDYEEFEYIYISLKSEIANVPVIGFIIALIGGALAFLLKENQELYIPELVVIIESLMIYMFANKRINVIVNLIDRIKEERGIHLKDDPIEDDEKDKSVDTIPCNKCNFSMGNYIINIGIVVSACAICISLGLYNEPKSLYSIASKEFENKTSNWLTLILGLVSILTLIGVKLKKK